MKNILQNNRKEAQKAIETGKLTINETKSLGHAIAECTIQLNSILSHLRGINYDDLSQTEKIIIGICIDGDYTDIKKWVEDNL